MEGNGLLQNVFLRRSVTVTDLSLQLGARRKLHMEETQFAESQNK